VSWRGLGDTNICGYCGTRFTEAVLNCPNPQCGKEFIVPHDVYMKNYARKALWMGIWGIISAPLLVGIFISLFGLTYALKAKSKGLVVLTLIPSVAMVAFFTWWFVVGL